MPSRAGDARYGDGYPTTDVRMGQQGELMMSELHGRYYEQAVRKNLCFSTSLARATSLGATSQIGNIVWNPPDSGVNLAITKWSSIIIATSATCTGIALGIGYQTTAPTSVTVADQSGCCYAQLTGASNNVWRAPKAKAYAIATLLISPVAAWVLHHNTAAIATTGEDTQSGDLEGSFVIPPGGIVTIQALGAAAAASAHSSSLMWEEIPIL